MATPKQILADIIVLLIAVAIGYALCYFTTPDVKEPKVISTEVEHYIIHESKQKEDSLVKLIANAENTIDSLKNSRNEKVIAHQPLPRPIPTDSTRTKNIQRFY